MRGFLATLCLLFVSMIPSSLTADIPQTAIDSVVRIHNEDGASGCGFVIGDGVDDKGDKFYTIMTNSHVALKAGSEVRIEFWLNGYLVKDIKSTTYRSWMEGDMYIDIAIIRVPRAALGYDPPISPLAEKGYKLRVGDQVTTIGCPMRWWPNARSGHIDKLTKDHMYISPQSHGGDSGGPVFNKSGNRVVGLTAWRVMPLNDTKQYCGSMTYSLIREVLEGKHGDGLPKVEDDAVPKPRFRPFGRIWRDYSPDEGDEPPKPRENPMRDSISALRGAILSAITDFSRSTAWRLELIRAEMARRHDIAKQRFSDLQGDIKDLRKQLADAREDNKTYRKNLSETLNTLDQIRAGRHDASIAELKASNEKLMVAQIERADRLFGSRLSQYRKWIEKDKDELDEKLDEKLENQSETILHKFLNTPLMTQIRFVLRVGFWVVLILGPWVVGSMFFGTEWIGKTLGWLVSKALQMIKKTFTGLSKGWNSVESSDDVPKE